MDVVLNRAMANLVSHTAAAKPILLGTFRVMTTSMHPAVRSQPWHVHLFEYDQLAVSSGPCVWLGMLAQDPEQICNRWYICRRGGKPEGGGEHPCKTHLRY